MAVSGNGDHTPEPGGYAWSASDWRDDVCAAVGHSLLSLHDLLRLAHDGASIPIDARFGCLEAFYMHARLVHEFFVKMPPKDRTARDFLPEWEPPDALRARLERVWLVASKHVVHLSRERVRDPDNFIPEDTSLPGLTTIARDCYCVAAAFVARYREASGAWNVDMWEGWLRGADTDLWVRDWITFPPG